MRSVEFDEESICRALGIEEMCDVASVNLDQDDLAEASAPLALLLRLFLGRRPVPRSAIERALGQPTLDAFLGLGILAADPIDPSCCNASVLLYPVAGFLIVSDRHTSPDGATFVAPPDIVFPAIFGGTLRFLELLPQSRAEDSLDLCSGSGIGAFVLSRVSGRAIASDVTERATHFARFNRALNGLDNVHVVCGDLYCSIAGQTFDRIVAHPPYVPSVNVEAIWRDGGETGELLVRRIIEGLPDHLRAGGLSCTVSIGLDTAEGRFEERVRQWLGEYAQEFDIIFAVADERTPEEVLGNLARQSSGPTPAEVAKLKNILDNARVVAMPYGALVIRRHRATGDRPGWTLRKRLGPAADGEDLERALMLHDRMSDPRFPERLELIRPELAPRLRVRVTHAVSQGALVPAEFMLEIDRPFIALGAVDGWMVPLLSRLDGKATSADIYAKAKTEGELPEGFGLHAFTGMLARMIERGFLKLGDDGEPHA